jgi:hypothetical protein
MSNEVLDELQQNEAAALALSVKYNHWSRVMIEVMIREQEQKLQASDLPVEGYDEPEFFWDEFA